MTTETGNPTELCLRLRKRNDKTHIYIHESGMKYGCYLYATWPYSGKNLEVRVRIERARFCETMTPGYYKTPGDAARAWHNYKAPGA